MSEISFEPWFLRPRPNDSASAWLLCFGVAGSNASSFHNWPQGLPGSIDVCAIQLPGRQRRFQEQPATRLLPLAGTIAEFLATRLNKPFAIFGACTGALLAFEVARAIRDRTGREPLHFVAAGCRAPHLPDRDPPIHGLPDATLIEQLHRLGGTELEILQHAELLKMILVSIRADFEAAETYPGGDIQPFYCPITAILGEDDTVVKPEDVSAWRGHTLGSFEQLTLPGGHFLVESHPAPVLQAVSHALREVASGGPAPIAGKRSRPSFRPRKDRAAR
jgi:medium-chain acyl-[acyl-carrier-protein] hydrolase